MSHDAKNGRTRRVLYIAYHFPPVLTSSGIQRTLKFVTYLREHGWESLVLTVSPRAYEAVTDGQMKEIPPNIVVERAFGLDTARHLAVRGRYFGWMALPDRWVSWWFAGVWRGMALIREYDPEVIVSTSPIVTAHLIGETLSRMSSLPWITDFRDSITEPGYPRDARTWRVHRRLEERFVRRSERVIFTTEGTRTMYAERYRDLPAARWAVIENGFDEENFLDAELGLDRAPLGSPGQITLLHSGILYPEERNPRAFFGALRALKERGEISAESLHVLLRATGTDELYRPMLASYGLEDIVGLEPAVGYRDALREMLRADGLLLFQAGMCNHQIPAKMYEYMRAGRPLFALTDPVGNTAQALRAAGVSSIVNIADQGDIERGLSGFLDELRAGRAAGVAREIAAKNSRRARTAELAGLLDEVAGARRMSVVHGGRKLSAR